MIRKGVYLVISKIGGFVKNMSKFSGYLYFGCGIITGSSATSIGWLCVGIVMIVIGARVLGEY
jgi:hypothetical protein